MVKVGECVHKKLVDSSIDVQINNFQKHNFQKPGRFGV
jgi:hypothetical protein